MANELNGVVARALTGAGNASPTAGMVNALVWCLGGGGGGGAVLGSVGYSLSAGGGGAGQLSFAVVTAAQWTGALAYSCGTGGVGGVVPTYTGGGGGATTFGALCTAGAAAGGQGGNNGSASPLGGAGGSGGTGLIASFGASGGSGHNINSAVATLAPGFGAASIWGQGGRGAQAAYTASAVGMAASGYGAGGSGAVVNNTATSQAGGAGSPGVILVVEFIGTGAGEITKLGLIADALNGSVGPGSTLFAELAAILAALTASLPGTKAALEDISTRRVDVSINHGQAIASVSGNTTTG